MSSDSTNFPKESIPKWNARMLLHACVAVIFLALTGSTEMMAQRNPFFEDAVQDESIFVPAPRELTRALSRARTASAERKYSEAIESLELILSSELKEDYFIRAGQNSETWVSVLSEVMKVIGNMPKRGRDIYELKFGIQAKKLLELAVRDGDIDQVRQISSQYFHTKAGYAATMLLGRYHLDQGEPLPAAISFKRIVETAPAREIYQPQVQMLLATSWYFAGLNKKAENVLLSFSRQNPEGKIGIRGKMVEVFQNNSEALNWLRDIVGTSPFEITEFEQQWTMHRGNPQRLAQSQMGIPLIQPNWRVPITNEKKSADVAAAISKEYLRDQMAAIPSINSLAVGNTVVMRSPTQIIGVDFTTGKRTWLFPWDKDDLIGSRVTEVEIGEARAANELRKQLVQRLYFDSIYGQMSSDGKRLFFVDMMGYASEDTYFRNVTGRMAPRKTNRLVALSLADEAGNSVQGKYKWWVGEKDGLDEPELAGAFFLGPPLPLQDDLYVICEIGQELRLAVLDNETGNLKWTQQLAAVDLAGDIAHDSIRRLAGATPSFSDGIIVCPTSTGAVVAIDASTRRLLWGFRYPQLNSRSAYAATRKIESRQPGQKWLDGSVTISGTNVILTPVESDRIFCIDLMSGQSTWTNQVSREQDVYVAGVYKNNLILTGKNRLRAIRLDDGSEGWTVDFAQHGLSSGRGYISQSQFLLPTTQSKLLKIDLDKPAIADVIETPFTLGNLIACQGKIVSHGTDWLSCFTQDEVARKRVAIALKTNPADLDALVLLGQLQINDRKFDDALSTLKTVHRSRNRSSVRLLLARAMVGALRTNFKSAIEKTVSVEDALVDVPELKTEYLHLKLNGLVREGKNLDAIKTLFELTAVDVSQVELRDGENLTRVRWDRQVQSRVKVLTENATGAELEDITAAIGEKVKEILISGSTNQLEKLADYLAKTELAETANIELARRYFLAGKFLAAELLFNELKNSQKKTIAATALAGLARIFDSQGRIPLALEIYGEVAGHYPDTVCWGDLTGKELLVDALKDNRFSQSGSNWAYGHVQVTELESSTQGLNSVVRIDKRLEPVERRWPAPMGIQVSRDPQNNLYFRDSTGTIIGKISLVEPGKKIRSGGHFNEPRYLLNGNLMIIVAGYNLVAIDLHRLRNEPETSVLWRIDNSPVQQVVNNRPLINHLSTQTRINDWGVLISNDVDQKDQARIGITAWPGRNGFCFTRGEDLVCVDPLTGEPIWTRIANIESGADCFSSEEHVFVIYRDQTVRQFAVFDGTEIAKFKLPEMEDRWRKFGSRFIGWTKDETKTTLFTYDLETRERLWEKDVPHSSRAAIVGSQRLAVREPDGTFYVIELNTGNILLKNKLDAGLFEPESLLVIEDEDRYFVAVNELRNMRDQAVVEDETQYTGQREGPVIKGPVYCIDKKSGLHLWHAPIMIDKFAFPVYQPSNLPALAFVRMRSVSAKANRTRRSTTDLTVVDKRDGQPVFSTSIAAVLHGYLVRGFGGENTVRIDLARKAHLLKFTDAPAPPSIPAQTGEYSSKLSDDVSVSFRRITGRMVAVSASGLKSGLKYHPRFRMASAAFQATRESAVWLRDRIQRASLEPIPMLKE